MAIEHAAVQVARKPWGVGDLHPWSSIDVVGDPVGELWFRRTHKHAPIPALLLKLLFTSEPLSIQVHPDDTFARAIGALSNKKSPGSFESGLFSYRAVIKRPVRGEAGLRWILDGESR